MFPQIVRIGDFFIPTYGVLVALALLAALWLTARLARRSGLEPETVVNLGVYCALAGILGAKLLMFAFDFDYYARNPREIFSLTTLQAGGVFQGGLALALITAIIYMRRKKLPGLATADTFSPGIALGHAIGRLGCFAAGCCWGAECHLPWAVTFTNTEAHRLVGVPLGVPLHPTQLYEAFAEAIIFAILYLRFGRSHRPGSIFGLYLLLYGSARFVVEFFRVHDQANPFGAPVSTPQWIALAMVGAGAWLLGRRS